MTTQQLSSKQLSSKQLSSMFRAALSGAPWQIPQVFKGTRGCNGAGFVTWVKRHGLLETCLASDERLAEAFSEWQAWRIEQNELKAYFDNVEINRAWAGLLRNCTTLVKHGIKVRTIVRYIGENM